MQLNRFKALNQERFLLIEGDPFISKRVEIIRPILRKDKGQAFTLFTDRNHLITSFYKVSDSLDILLIGAQKNSTLIWLWRGDFGFDLFKKNSPIEEVREMLISGGLKNEFEFSQKNKKQ